MAVQTPPRALSTTRPAAPKPGTGRPWMERWGGLFFVAPFLLLFAVFLLWPIVSGLWNSFFNTSLAGSSTSSSAWRTGGRCSATRLSGRR